MNSIEDLIFKLENDLLKPEVRKDKERIKELLSEDFFEFCSTGEIYKYKAGDTFYEENVSFEISNFNLKKLSDDCLLATYMVLKKYEVNNCEKSSIRSSVWRYIDGNWKMIFHQGTFVVTK
ncbi:DUF4440 domain-containing protein [Clostridium sp. 1001275B_160808_H3]|uniref:nuclear transport factor 2 family protein n=1 Tax=Clostridium sp. 1001275B_160808_H3 TaxID=2787110 RepID=UPI00189B0718|nr:DUF4440 domain-containing protein [Clostridium sp. 1001275B_160808_H3]